MRIKIFKLNSGMTLVEAIISIAIISIIAIGIFGLAILTVKLTAENKNIVGASAIADREIEKIRSLNYDKIGTINGDVKGIIEDNKEIIENGQKFNVNTVVLYQDDPFDGTMGGSPNDTIPNDYKLVSVRVSWGGNFGAKEVDSSAVIASNKLETAVAGGGILAIQVYHKDAVTPVNAATVKIKNSGATPLIDYNIDTGPSGKLNIVNATSTGQYNLEITKSGYSTYRTYPDSPFTELRDPKIIADQLYTLTAYIDKVSQININTYRINNFFNNWDVQNNTNWDNKYPSITMDNDGYVYVAWQDKKTSQYIYFQKFDQSGTPQLPSSGNPQDIKISNLTSSYYPDIKASLNNYLYATWYRSNIIYLKIFDPTNFVDTDKIQVDNSTSGRPQVYPKIAILDDGINTTSTITWLRRHATWATTSDVYIQQITPSKNRGWTNDVKLNPTDYSVYGSYQPAIAMDKSGNSYVAWTENNGTTASPNYNVYMQKVNWLGVSQWGSPKIVHEKTSSYQLAPSLAVDSNNYVYVAWTDYRRGTANMDIYMQKFNGNGDRQWTSTGDDEKRVNQYATTTRQLNPSIDVDKNNNIYVAWQDNREHGGVNYDIYAQKFDTNGNPLWSEDLKLNTDESYLENLSPKITTYHGNNSSYFGDYGYATWMATTSIDTTATSSIKATKFETLDLSPLSNVPIRLYGEKLIYDSPVVYQYDEVHTSNETGQINLNNIGYGDYKINLQTGYSSYSIYTINIPNNQFINPDLTPFYINPNTTNIINVYLKN